MSICVIHAGRCTPSGARGTEPKVAALSVPEHQWVNRHARKHMLIVIDEAHNLCSPTPTLGSPCSPVHPLDR